MVVQPLRAGCRRGWYTDCTFYSRGNARNATSDAPDALAIAKVEPEDSGSDTSLLVIETAEELSRSRPAPLDGDCLALRQAISACSRADHRPRRRGRAQPARLPEAPVAAEEVTPTSQGPDGLAPDVLEDLRPRLPGRWPTCSRALQRHRPGAGGRRALEDIEHTEMSRGHGSPRSWRGTSPRSTGSCARTTRHSRLSRRAMWCNASR